MPSLNPTPAARTLAAPCSLAALILLTGGCIAQMGDLGSIDLPATEATSNPTEDPTVTGDPTMTPPEGPPDDWDGLLAPQPGTRLRPIVRTADDGSTQHVAWHDTQEDVRCSFRVGDDDVRRCFPEQQADYVYYADPACEVPVMRTYDGIPHDILELRGAVTCGLGTFYRLDPEPFVGTLYRDDGGDGCVEHSHDLGYYKGTAMSHADFVPATFAPAEGVSRIVPLQIAAEDGARAIVGAWDREHGEPVAAQPGADADALRWFGANPAHDYNLFDDAACTSRIAASGGCSQPDIVPTTAQTFAQIDCTQQPVQRWRLGEPVAPTAAFRGDACESTPTDYWDQLYTLAEPLTDADFAAVTSATVGATRLQHDVYGNPEGEPFLGADVFFDPALGEPCRFNYDATDNSSQCEPLAIGSPSGIYLDDACTQPIAYVISRDGCPNPTANWAIGQDGTFWPLLQPTEWGTFKLVDDTCMVADDSLDYPGGLEDYSLYTMGPPADLKLVSATDIVQ